jgi:Pyruvate/2-oxoacid:ferredoxin oxidoreductase delta subunit
LNQRLTEEQLLKKKKEVEALAKEKKCKGCYVCLEDLRDKP